MTAFLYGLTVLIWGTTWIAIKMQLGVVAIEASIIYRFTLAGLTLFLILLISRRLKPIAWRDQPFILLQGLCLFCFNFICFYTATQYIVSGLTAVIFSTATILNVVNSYIFHRRTPTMSTLIGAILGVMGVVGLFWDGIIGKEMGTDMLIGLGLSVLGTYFFSLGNLVSARNQKHGITVASANAHAMLYGSIVLALIAAGKGVTFSFDTSLPYVGGLLFLAIPGSVIAFTTYLWVVGRLGPEKAAYMTVLFPVVALSISTVWEGYHWAPSAIIGLLAILAGNILVLTNWDKVLRARKKPAKTSTETA
ncbi:DMT family transporter [Aestuariispira ectoiniformans]|uniref:DMT family transporter n=1 Tax=Aestuariispira ectoiniformans TaxID=2775080 RepID=UPI00223B5A73|nr:DMT family transporter [Aestuariispira ectoiniformans]